LTKIINAVDNYKKESLFEASQCLKMGGLVVFPTETVYGIGANAYDENAVAKIFSAKGRPQDNPLIVHISSFEMLKEVAYIDNEELINRIVNKFWPGPLTIILRKKEKIPFVVSANLNTIGVRMPNNKVALDLIDLGGVPIAAPSANISGRPSPVNVEHVIEDLFGKVDYIIDGGNCSVGIESTIIDLSTEKPVILRPGIITIEMLKEIVPDIAFDDHIFESVSSPKAPGMKYRHYSPNAKMIIVKGTIDKRLIKIKQLLEMYKKQNMKVGILTFYETEANFNADVKITMGSLFDLKTCARNLFKSLREFDRQAVDLIIVEWTELKGIGIALQNRLYKASGYNIIEV